MAIEKRFWGFYVTCDGCSYFYTHEVVDDYKGAVAAVKAEGWKFRKDENGKWLNYCFVCAERRMM